MSGTAALLGALGAVLFGFGLLSAILGLFQPVIDPVWLTWVGGNLAIGALLVGVAVVSNLDALRERMRSGGGRRAGTYGTSSLLSTVFGIAILCLLAFLSVRYDTRFDWTGEKVHTLSDQTQKVLASLDEDVRITAFFNPLDAPPYRDLLDRYAYASERVKVTFADPNARPDLVEELELDGRDLARGLIRIEVGGQSVDLTEFDEASITNALVKLTRGGARKVYFLKGHNERPAFGEEADEGRGMARARTALENESYEVAELFLATLADVPDDADAVVIAGPTRPLRDEEHAALDRYLARGGGVVAMIDPRANTDLDADLRRWGVEVGNDVIVDRSLALFGRATSPFAAGYGDHPITREMRETVLFHVARSVRPAPDATDRFTVLVSTGESSWAETDLAQWANEGTAAYDPASDQLGPVPVAVAGTPRVERRAEPGGAEAPGATSEAAGAPAAGAAGADAGEAAAPAAEPRLVVFGDSDFATNELIDAYRNRDLFVNAVNWAIGDVESISVRPHKARASRFQLTQEQFRMVQVLSLFVLPELIAIAGVLAWWWRRKAPGR